MQCVGIAVLSGFAAPDGLRTLFLRDGVDDGDVEFLDGAG